MGRRFENFDIAIVISIGILLAFSLFTLFSSEGGLFNQQLAFIAVGILSFYIFSKFDRDLLIWLSPVFYIIGLIFLIVTLFMPEIRGSRRWIEIGGAQIQPSELLKPFLFLMFSFLADKFPVRTLKYIPIHILTFILPFALVFLQPDLGTAIIYFTVWLGMVIAAGFPVIIILVGMFFSFLGLPVIWNLLESYQKLRIETFINPAIDPKGAGYNAIQAIIAVGSGRLFGKGLGFGTQSQLRFLPEHQTDFIFASIVEQLGFIGGLILVSTYALLLISILYYVWKNTDDKIIFIYGIGLFTMILSQIFINTGMNMGILPITGITLPFVSYGGSSVLSLFIAFGIFWAVKNKK